MFSGQSINFSVDSGNSLPGSDPAEPPQARHRWANFLGTVVAILTLAIPTVAILYYSYPPDGSAPQSLARPTPDAPGDRTTVAF